MPDNQSEIAIVTAETIQDKIYVVRGQQVMLAADLADIYGYEHKSFNRQVMVERLLGNPELLLK